jgi:membrane associated rhomboid family serine protease
MAEFTTGEEFLIVEAMSRKEFNEIELLFLSRSIPFTSQNGFYRKELYVPIQYGSFAKKELTLYVRENKNWPPVNKTYREDYFPFSMVHVFVFACFGWFHWKTHYFFSGIDWMTSGRFSADRVLSGEWSRTVTALTLHLDDAHFISNFFGLLVFVGSVNKFVGGGVSWMLVLLAGALGNYLNALLYQTAHRSVGASTAVFGAIGIIGALAIKYQHRLRQFKGWFFLPIIGAFGILAMLGTNPQTDVTAHLFGFFSGVGIGLLFLPLSQSKWLESAVVQLTVLLGFGCIVYACWRLQITR